MKLNFKHTKIVCYVSYVTQAAVCCIASLLFSAFEAEFSLSLTKLSMIVVVNFVCQMTIDLLSAKFIGKMGYRAAVILSSALSAAGLLLLGLLPYVMNPFAGILIAVACYSAGGGFVDAVVSPVIEDIPSDHKASEMSLLHSFFCWGTVFVILLATGYFALFSTKNWRFLPMTLAIIPLFTLVAFCKVPLPEISEEARSSRLVDLFKAPVFYLLLCLMALSGAAEQLMSQWASFFAEKGLGVSKAAGDLLGPCAFAVLMGISRTIYGVKGQKFRLCRAICLSAALCVVCYLVTVFAPVPVISLLGCAMTGFAVGILWPGCVSVGAKRLPAGGAGLFALLALAGDVGCTAGPALVGLVSDAVEGKNGGVFQNFLKGGSVTEISMKAGILVGIVFPLLFFILALFLRKKEKSPEGFVELSENPVSLPDKKEDASAGENEGK